MAKSCSNCGSTDLETDYSAGNVVCRDCYAIVESGILVSEVGFSEGSGGRVHVQGAFVSNFSTGISGFRGRGGIESSENVKKQGHERIRMVAEQMGISGSIYRAAQRFFTIAVDAKFNRGRRTEYIVASCLYLQCRYANSDKMLIDFSERLTINVFELGATYLKLRSALHLKDPMPEVDPAIYNIRFAHRLSFGSNATVNSVAADATRLVRRFKADWMTQGRRPAGVCGACMIIAARMSGFLRTPEEVAQVVKVAPITIRRRLIEFARTEVASKTVDEWRQMSDQDLDNVNPQERPPVIKAQIAAAKRKMTAERIQQLREDNGDDDELLELQAMQQEEEGSIAGGNEGDVGSDETPNKRRRTSKGKGKQVDRDEADGQEETDMTGALRAVVQQYGGDDADEQAQLGEDDDDTLPEMEQGDYITDLQAARDNPEKVAQETKKESRAWKSQIRSFNASMTNDDLEDLENLGIDQDGNLGSGVEDNDVDEDGEGDEAGEGDVDEDTRQEGDKEGEGSQGKKGKQKGKEEHVFTEWDDEDATLLYLGNRFFASEAEMFKLTTQELKQRVRAWITTRDPRQVVAEVEAVERARKRREKIAKQKAETVFDDIDDKELEAWFVLEEDEVRLRARLWLSHNGRWLEEDKERQAKKAAYNRAHNIDPSKPKPKRKRKAPQKGPFPSAREAMDTISTQKKFSSRINYGALEALGLAKEEMGGLQSFDDEKEDEKYDEGKEYDDEEGKEDEEEEEEEDDGDQFSWQ